MVSVACQSFTWERSFGHDKGTGLKYKLVSKQPNDILFFLCSCLWAECSLWLQRRSRWTDHLSVSVNTLGIEGGRKLPIPRQTL